MGYAVVGLPSSVPLQEISLEDRSVAGSPLANETSAGAIAVVAPIAPIAKNTMLGREYGLACGASAAEKGGKEQKEKVAEAGRPGALKSVGR